MVRRRRRRRRRRRQQRRRRRQRRDGEELYGGEQGKAEARVSEVKRGRGNETDSEERGVSCECWMKEKE